MTELQELKKKCFKKDGSPKKGAKWEDLARLKVLQDGEPLTEADLANVEKRQAEQKTKDKAEYDARQAAKTVTPTAARIDHDGYKKAANGAEALTVGETTPSLDVPAEHPRIVALKKALEPFTKIEEHPSRANEFVLFTRGISITAGDVRAAKKAMKL